MKTEAVTPKEYIESLPEDRQLKIQKLREVITANLPKGFEETMNYGMIGYVVPHSIYPNGYHCDAAMPLPFMNIASQKNHITIYHNGIYADSKLLEWFISEYKKYSSKKPNMGKSCIRFSKTQEIPYQLFGDLASKLKPLDWIAIYEAQTKKS
ncbi:DUF1801 domain-containing protein [Zunongwangia atlantica]|uniref:YdhG-like domain-containing protein n=1 Tax=Zunongwangia atlantica 22II14-10F7 TaxID=1185767 RepID=A0A1Y1T439_9FLAO|nr:DUF1801 domain-containing protein [Zunongwangia atlantica]ORL45354.1 hypothetical protein IIF7_11048 [Zunongwangia atlantica 22II14-10F7]